MLFLSIISYSFISIIEYIIGKYFQINEFLYFISRHFHVDDQYSFYYLHYFDEIGLNLVSQPLTYDNHSL